MPDRNRGLHGTVAAALTPLRVGGRELDEAAFEPYVDFLVAGGLTGLMTLGSTGEGILFDTAERKRVTELFLQAAGDRLLVAAHCGAQTTADSVTLAEHAAAAGVDAVSAIGPPYFQLDAVAQYRHLRAIANACAPTPFYVYELAAAAGYPFDPPTLVRLRETCENVKGIKVSDAPWEPFSRYLLEGFDVLVGPEALIDKGMKAGAAGAISALAAALPELVAGVVARPTAAGSERLRDVRATVDGLQRHAALKRLLARRGIPINPDVRAPLRDLDEQERRQFDDWAARALE